MGPTEAHIVEIENFPPSFPAAPHEHFLVVLAVAFLLVLFASWWVARWLVWFERADHRREREAERALFDRLYAQAARRGERAECARLELAAACKGLEISPKLKGLCAELEKTEPEPGEPLLVRPGVCEYPDCGAEGEPYTHRSLPNAVQYFCLRHVR